MRRGPFGGNIPPFQANTETQAQENIKKVI